MKRMKLIKGMPIKYRSLIRGRKGHLENVELEGIYIATIPIEHRKDNKFFIILTKKGDAQRVSTLIPAEPIQVVGMKIFINGKTYQIAEVGDER